MRFMSISGRRAGPGFCWRRSAPGVALGLALTILSTLPAQPALAATDESAVERSAMDAPLLYQILIGELELNAGRNTHAFEVLFDAARRTRDENLFKRAVQVALQSRSADQVQAAVTAWRRTLPQSQDAMRYQLQIAVALNRVGDAVEPFNSALEKTPAQERGSVIASLPSLLERLTDRSQAASAFEPSLLNAAQTPALRPVALSTLGRLWLAANDAPKAAELADRGHKADPSSTAPVALALETMARAPAAEAVVQAYLTRSDADPSVRLAYGQALAQQQRHSDALQVLQRAVADKPDHATAWLTIGALQLELKQLPQAQQALERFLALTPAEPASIAAAPATQDVLRAATVSAGRAQAFLMLSQVAEQRGDFVGANAWLEKVDADDRRALDVRVRRASLLAKQGKVAEARALVQAAPEQSAEDARAKLLAESQLLRDLKRWQEAFDVLSQGVQRFPDDVDLKYEQAMMAEKLGRMDVMEQLLREVIADKPDHQHAYNALGYSLADRGQRLDEAKQLVRKALDLAPGDPFITDSLGWIEFRLGNRDEALRLLKQAWATRPDTEIGAHLGEVLWSAGQRDEARRIWLEAKGRDGGNDVLRETLQRLKVDL